MRVSGAGVYFYILVWTRFHHKGLTVLTLWRNLAGSDDEAKITLLLKKKFIMKKYLWLLRS